MNFVPTFHKQKFVFFTEFLSFAANCGLKCFFFSEKGSERVKSNIPERLKKSSNFDPPINNIMLEAFQKTVILEVFEKWEEITNQQNN